MQYDSYQRKIDKIASFIRYIFKHIIKIGIAVAVVVAATVTVLATKGIIISEDACPKSVVYGEKLSYSAKAFLSQVEYEYCAYGTNDWSSEEPVMPGQYNVRAVSQASFGGKKYGNVETFTILPKDITVYPSETKMYGDKTSPVCELVQGDSFLKCDFSVLSINAANLEETVCADTASIVIVDANGNDVTKAYNITVKEGKVSITKRTLTLNIGSKTAEYDGNPLYCEEYEIAEGSVAESNRLELLFDDYAMHVGTVSNDPIISLTDENGKDVSAFYQISVNYGELTVTPRYITVSTKDGEYTYNGKEQFHLEIELLEGELAADQYLMPGDATPVVDAGEYENDVSALVFDLLGRNVTRNYVISYDYGKITIKKRPIVITTVSEEFVYDGYSHSRSEAYGDNLVEGQAIFAEAWKVNPTLPNPIPSIKYVGSISNTFNCCILDMMQRDVTHNYEITYDYGTLTVVPRPIIVCTDSLITMYDGEEHAADGVWTYLDLDKDGKPDSDIIDYPWAEDGHTYPEGLAPTDALVVSSYTTITNAGTKENVLEIDILSPMGSVMENYSITYEYGTLKVTPRPITVQPKYTQVVYDGNSHGGEGVELTEWSLSLISGHNLQFDGTISGSRVDAGMSALVLEGDCFVFDGDIDVSYNYDITFETGFVEILRRPITVYTGSDEKMYDGTPLTNSEYGVLYFVDEDIDEISPYMDVFPSWEYPVKYDLVEGHELILTTDGAITDVGTTSNTVSEYIILSGEDDVTDNYDVSFEYGELKVTPRTITVATGSNTWVYNDRPHSDRSYSVVSEIDLVHMHSLVLVGDSVSITNVGTEENVFEVVVVDEYGWNISHNYEITYEYGTLTVTPRPITVQTESMSWEYEDVYFSYDVYSIIEGEIIWYHDFWAVEVASIRDVGSCDNAITIEIYKWGEDVTYNYDITYVYGTLSVTPRPITVTSGSQSRVYDGTRWSYGEYVISDKELIDSHWSLMLYSTWVCDVTSTPNELEILIFNGEDEDVTKNYAITYEYGTLEVTKRPIEIVSATDAKNYDGTPLTNAGYFISRDYYPLVEGHDVSVDIIGSITLPGVVYNTIVEDSARVYANGKDVTANYELYFREGILAVMRTGDIEIPDPEGTLEPDPEGTLEPDPEGTLKPDPEETVEPNPEGTLKPDPEGTLEPDPEGTLKPDPEETVEPNPEDTEEPNPEDTEEPNPEETEDPDPEDTEEPNPEETEDPDPEETEEPNPEETGTPEEDETGDSEGSGGGSGQLDLSGNISGGSLGNGGGGGLLTPSYVVWSTKDGRIYLRVKSFGDYHGNGFNEAGEYPFVMNFEYSHLYLASIALKEYGSVADVIRIKSLNGQYVLPYYADPFLSGLIQTSDVLVSGDPGDYYQLDIYTLGNIGELGLSEEYAEYEREYRQFVYQNYLAIDGETLEYMQGIIASQGFSISSGSVIADVASYIANSAVYDLKYDRELDQSENVVVAFLETYKSGICQHYAASAVMLYRALGIPARYTIGYAVDAKAGEWTVVTGMEAHAWVEVYVDGIGWIMVEVTGSGNDFGDTTPDEPEESKQKLTISPTYQYKEFDGTPLYAVNEISVSFELQELLDKGYSYDVVVVGSQTVVGTGESRIQSFILYDEFGNDVTDKFDITYETGSLVVANYTVKILLYKLQKHYDGTPLAFMDGDYEFISELPEGMTIDIDFNISLTDAGQLTMSDINHNISEYITYTVYMYGVPVTDSVLLVVDVFDDMSDDYVPIRIDRLDIELTAASTSKDYDGEALEYDKVYISKGSLADGDVLEAHASGIIVDEGQAPNVIFEEDVRIINRYGEDVTDNYNITLIEGTLTVY